MKDFVFRKRLNNRLEFVGDFESLYQTDPDPWDQAGQTGQISQYYLFSRARLLTAINGYVAKPLKRFTGLEIGCGHGHVLNLLSSVEGSSWTGMDISQTALVQAQLLYPKLSFVRGDITLPMDGGRFDVIVLNQLLWYVMHQMETVIGNCHRMLNQDGILIVSHAFLKEQQYGKNLIDGFSGLVELFMRKHHFKFRLLEARYDDTGRYVHNDGIVVLRKI